MIGLFFGIVATKSEIVSWYRIQEMFRFQSFLMYGIIGSAVPVGVRSGSTSPHALNGRLLLT